MLQNHKFQIKQNHKNRQIHNLQFSANPRSFVPFRSTSDRPSPNRPNAPICTQSRKSKTHETQISKIQQLFKNPKISNPQKTKKPKTEMPPNAHAHPHRSIFTHARLTLKAPHPPKPTRKSQNLFFPKIPQFPFTCPPKTPKSAPTLPFLLLHIGVIRT